MNEVLWTEKYRPRTLSECVLPAAMSDQFSKMVAAGVVPNLLLSGKPGTGKTTVALAVLRELGCDSMVINASLHGNIDTLRTEITQFASSVSLSGGRKYVILDEADYLNPNSTQPSLRNFIETFSVNCGFILTCNYPNRIIDPLRSRLVEIDFKVPNDEVPDVMSRFYRRATEILRAENVDFDKKAVAEIVDRQFPDWRRAVSELQSRAARGRIDATTLGASKTNLSGLLIHMKAGSYEGIADWVRDSDVDHTQIFRDLYDELRTALAPSDVPLAIVLIAKYQNMSAHVADQGINTTAMIVEITAECKFK